MRQAYFRSRLGESGCDVWTLARIAGHSSIAMSARYVHPSADRVLNAMGFLGRHKTGHNDEQQPKQEIQQLEANTEGSKGRMVGSAGLEPATSCL